MGDMLDCIDLLKKMVSIPSESRNEEELAQFLEGILRDELGMETQLQPVEGKSYNVIGRWRQEKGKGKQRRKLLLGGHLDTVPPTPRWRTDPYTLTEEGDMLRGLGAADMKGGLAAQITVLRRIREEGRRLDAEVEFVGVADEERYSLGAHAYADKSKHSDNSFFILAEPHFDNLVVGATGKILLRLKVTGEGGHAATPEQGVNAVDCMALLLCVMNQRFMPEYLAGKRGSYCCLNVQSNYSGYSLNIPEECTCLVNKQLTSDEETETFIEELQNLYRSQIGRGKLEIIREIPSYPSYCLSADQKDVAGLTTYLRETFGHEPELRINQSVSDGNIFIHRLGIPTVLFGPQGFHFHTENEYLSRDSLGKYIEELYGFIVNQYREF